MSNLWRTRLMAAAALPLAVWLAVELADGSYILPALFGVLGLAAIATRLTRLPVDVMTLAVLLFGYVVGNRGFAQLMPLPGLPLLPAELGLLIVASWCAVRCALAHELPFRRDILNFVVLAWLIGGSVRVFLDVRQFGFVALRDFAMVYYAAFFFLTQHLATDPRSRRFLLGVLVAAAVIQPFAALLSDAFPEFFYRWFAIRGVPLILFKGDLVFTFMGVGAFVLAFALPARHRRWAWIVASLELVFVIAGANRASMVGAVIALAWLSFSRVKRFVGLQLGVLLLALLCVSGLALLGGNSWAERKLDGLAERAQSLGDLLGTGTYVSEESSMKGDNNRFRTVWWRTVIDDTLANNPVFGLGFGYDLANAFLQEYNPEMSDDFTARSPHSIVVSAFGRMGLVGLAIFLALIVTLAVRTWRAVRDETTPEISLGLWACVWVILVSACFGVVLEGPMAAVVFWSILGLLNAASRETVEGPAATRSDTAVSDTENTLATAPTLPSPGRPRELSPASNT